MSAWILDFVTEVRARTGQLAMIYTNPNWWGPCTNNDATFGAYPLFNSGYMPSPPPTPAGWATWTFWQYDDAGSLPGDQDVFNGDYAALTRLAGGVPAPIALLANVNGRFVTAEDAGNSPLIANRTAINLWEQFFLVDAGNGYYALESKVNGRYVTAEDAGNSPLIANRAAVSTWERFQIVNTASAPPSTAGTSHRRTPAIRRSSPTAPRSTCGSSST